MQKELSNYEFVSVYRTSINWVIKELFSIVKEVVNGKIISELFISSEHRL